MVFKQNRHFRPDPFHVESHVRTCSDPPSHFPCRNSQAARKTRSKEDFHGQIPITGSDVFGREEFLDRDSAKKDVNVVTFYPINRFMEGLFAL